LDFPTPNYYNRFNYNLRQVEDESPRGGTQAADRLVWKSERSGQSIKVVALGLVLQDTSIT
jgi:hypothetical protein